MRREKPHPSLTLFALCDRFKCLPSQLRKESARDIEHFMVIMNELGRMEKEELEKAKRRGR